MTSSTETPDTFGVYLWEASFPPGWDCIAICDTPERVTKHVIAYQEATRGKCRIKVDRLPRGKDAAKTRCGYCGAAHWGKCRTDDLGNPTTEE